MVECLKERWKSHKWTSSTEAHILKTILGISLGMDGLQRSSAWRVLLTTIRGRKTVTAGEEEAEGFGYWVEWI